MKYSIFKPTLLSNVLNFFNGKSIKPGGDGEYPVYGSNGLIGRSGEYTHQNGLIIGRVGAYCGAINYCKTHFWASDNTIVGQPKDISFDVEYICYLLGGLNLNRYAGGSAQPLLTQTVLRQVPTSIPPLSTQRKIAAFLDHKTGQIDELIRVKERKIKLLQEQRTALINHAVTKGLDPNVKMKPSGVEWIGEIPGHWEMRKIKNTQSGLIGGVWGSEPEGNDTDIYCIRVADFNYAQLAISTINLTLRNVPLRASDKRVLCAGDLLIEKSGGGEKSPVGRTVIFHSEMPRRTVTSNFISKFTVKLDSCFARYSLYCFSFLYQIGLTRRHIKQSTGLQNLDIDSYFQERIPFPNLIEQTQIADFLDRKTARIDELVSEEQRSIELLKEYRQSLISDAVTGKIDVRNEV